MGRCSLTTTKLLKAPIVSALVSALKLQYDEPLSNYAFSFNMRRYTMESIPKPAPVPVPEPTPAACVAPSIQVDGTIVAPCGSGATCCPAGSNSSNPPFRYMFDVEGVIATPRGDTATCYEV
jgi:hypothetical protein